MSRRLSNGNIHKNNNLLRKTMEKETSNTTTSNEERDLLKEKNTLEAIESKFTAVVCYPHFMIGITPKAIYLIKKRDGGVLY